MTDARARYALLAILVVAFALRLPGDAHPPGLYRDEAFYGLDAVATLEEGPRLWYPANNGREPLFIWLVAAFVGVLGQTPAAVRFPAGLSGVLMVAGVYALTARLAGRRAALVAAALAAVVPWAVLSARTGFRASLLPAALVVAAAATARAAATGRGRHAAIAGLLGGLTLYTYAAARLAPLVALAAWLAWRPAPPRRRRVTAAWLAAAALVALPMAVALATTPGALTGRAGQVAVWRTEEGGAAAAILESARAVAGMVVLRGDVNLRHNAVYAMPVLKPLAGALWAIGCAVVLLGLFGQGRLGRTSAVTLAAWAVAMGIPSVLAEDAPHFLRGIGLLPLILVVAGIGAGALFEALQRWPGGHPPVWAHRTAAGTVAVALLQQLLAPSGDGWVNSYPYFAFEGGASDLASTANQSLGSGWRGGWAVGPEALGQRVWLDRRLRDGWAAVPYLVPIDRVTLTDPYDPVLREPGVAFMVPYGLDLERVWAERPSRLDLRLTYGAFEQGDLASKSTRMWVALERLSAPAPVDQPLAVYENGMILEWARVVPAGDRAPDAPWPLWESVFEMAWRLPDRLAGGEPRVVVPARLMEMTSGGVGVLVDAPLGGGVFPAAFWRAGDRLIERVPLRGWEGGELQLGPIAVYAAGAEHPLEATDGAGRPIDGPLIVHP